MHAVLSPPSVRTAAIVTLPICPGQSSANRDAVAWPLRRWRPNRLDGQNGGKVVRHRCSATSASRMAYWTGHDCDGSAAVSEGGQLWRAVLARGGGSRQRLATHLTQSGLTGG